MSLYCVCEGLCSIECVKNEKRRARSLGQKRNTIHIAALRSLLSRDTSRQAQFQTASTQLLTQLRMSKSVARV